MIWMPEWLFRIDLRRRMRKKGYPPEMARLIEKQLRIFK